VSPKPVIHRVLAVTDVQDAVAYYLKEDAQDDALAFVDALEDAYAVVGQHPAIGSSRYAIDLEIPGIRSWALPRFPYVIFYVERDDHIDVWRVLHGRRDIPTLLQDPDSAPE
jgi:toxin ParE1/3/4